MPDVVGEEHLCVIETTGEHRACGLQALESVDVLRYPEAVGEHLCRGEVLVAANDVALDVEQNRAGRERRAHERIVDAAEVVDDLRVDRVELVARLGAGQQQLAAIARALACDPPLLVADEPTGNLDSKSANTIIDLFEELSRHGKTVLMVTHDPSLTSRTTRNIVIADGIIVGDSRQENE